MSPDRDQQGVSRDAWLTSWVDLSEAPEPMTFLATTESPDLVVDLWEREQAAPGSRERIAVVVSMRAGVGPRSFAALPFAPWGHAGSVAVAWDGVAATPRERLLEAAWQGHLRALDRLGGSLEFHQVWPPT